MLIYHLKKNQIKEYALELKNLSSFPLRPKKLNSLICLINGRGWNRGKRNIQVSYSIVWIGKT